MCSRVPRGLLILGAIALLAGRQLGAQSVPPPTPGSESCARLATVALGDALDQVRAARVFADDSRRRQALAELEILLIQEIEAEPDTSIRKTAWQVADVMKRVPQAQDKRANMERDVLAISDLDLRDKTLNQLFTQWYRFHIRGVLGVTEPGTRWRCAHRRWEELNAQALRAEAL